MAGNRYGYPKGTSRKNYKGGKNSNRKDYGVFETWMYDGSRYYSFNSVNGVWIYKRTMPNRDFKEFTGVGKMRGKRLRIALMKNKRGEYMRSGRPEVY